MTEQITNEFTYKNSTSSKCQCFENISPAADTTIQENRNSTLHSFHNLPFMTAHYEMHNHAMARNITNRYKQTDNASRAWQIFLCKFYERVGMIYYVIWCPYLLSFDSFNNVIFRIFTCLFASVGNKPNEKSTVKMSKKGPKKETHGIARQQVGHGRRPCAGRPARGCGDMLSADPCLRVFADPTCFLF